MFAASAGGATLRDHVFAGAVKSQSGAQQAPGSVQEPAQGPGSR